MKAIIFSNHLEKKAIVISLIFIIILAFLPSCQKCELIEQHIVYPPKICSGTFYFNKVVSAMDTTFTFNTLEKPLSQSLNPVVKAGPFSLPGGALNLRSNFSAYDSINGIYAFEFLSTSNTAYQFYFNQTANNISANTSLTDYFVSPAFQMERMFVISVETFGSDLQYSIGEIDPLTGLNGTGLTGNTVTINSRAYPGEFSSVSADNGLVYFLSGTNLIEYNSLNNSSRYIDLDPTYNAVSNPVGYNGLEYDVNQDVLLCMKISPDGPNDFRTTLISVKITPTGTQQNTIFDITANLPPGHSSQINPDFYSTTFDGCDTTYYITELNTFNPLTTNFMEIAIHRQKLTNHVVDGYWVGLEYVESE